MNRKQFENNIRHYPLEFLGNKGAKTEHARLHNFIDVYNEMFDMYGRPPSMQEYIDRYFQVAGYEYDVGIDARARRAYASIVREHHGRLLLADYFDDVKYDAFADKAHGIDATITINDVEYNIHFMMDTYRSNVFRRQKETKTERGIHIDMKLNTKEATDCGDFLLYGDKQIQWLYSEIKRVNTKTLTITVPYDESMDTEQLPKFLGEHWQVPSDTVTVEVVGGIE